MNYTYGTLIRSLEPICFTGDFLPFTSPACVFKLGGEQIRTTIHQAYGYAIDYAVLEAIINVDFIEN